MLWCHESTGGLFQQTPFALELLEIGQWISERSSSGVASQKWFFSSIGNRSSSCDEFFWRLLLLCFLFVFELPCRFLGASLETSARTLCLLRNFIVWQNDCNRLWICWFMNLLINTVDDVGWKDKNKLRTDYSVMGIRYKCVRQQRAQNLADDTLSPNFNSVFSTTVQIPFT